MGRRRRSRRRRSDRGRRGHHNRNRTSRGSKPTWEKAPEDETYPETFEHLGLSEPVVEAVRELGYKEPSEIQGRAIPRALTGRDVIGLAQTGTGKTAAFLLPVIEQMNPDEGLQTLVITPTRELAKQIYNAARDYCRFTRTMPAVVYGGQPKDEQEGQFAYPVQLLIATPGRLLDFLYSHAFDIQQVKHLILDEADRMLDMGFMPDIESIIEQMPRRKQTLLFSATMPPEIAHLASNILSDPIEVSVGIKSSVADGVEQTLFQIAADRKQDFLVDRIRDLGDDLVRLVVFTRTKRGADKLTTQLRRAGVKADAIHSDRSQDHRERALQRFREGRLPVLVATNVASRGLDIDEISHVVNFDVPHAPEDYVHRVGRTARMDAEGHAWTLASPQERQYVQRIEKLLGKSLPTETIGSSSGNGGGRRSRRRRSRRRRR